MTEAEIAGLGPAFAAYLRRYRTHIDHDGTARHFDTYCRGLLSDLPRKSVEPIALAGGTAVRTLQMFLAASQWDHDSARTTLQRYLGEIVAGLPADRLGTVGVIHETSCRKWGDQTPGVQRQYLGCEGKVENGIVTVHVGVAKGTFQALLDADLYLPESWSDDRERCRAAGIPDAKEYQPKWQLAYEQLCRLRDNGVSFDWLTFDEGYGAAVPLLRLLNADGQRFVAEIPINFAVRDTPEGPSRRADARLPGAAARGGTRHRIGHQTIAPSYWRATSVRVWVADRVHLLVVAINEATAEVKYFLTNATTASMTRILGVAFRRWTIEQGFRLGKQEAGLMDYEGRSYVGLVRHLVLALIVLGFVATQTERLRGEKSPGDGRAGVSGVERAVCDAVPPASGRGRRAARGRSDPLPPATQRRGRPVA